MKEPLPLKPRAGKSKLALMGQLLQDCIVVNATLFTVFLAIAPGRHTMGSNATAHRDPRTGRPVLQELKGCTIVGPSITKDE